MIFVKERKYYDDKWFKYILGLLDSKRFEQALIEFADYIESFPYDVCARTSYASLLTDFKRLEEAETIINETIITKKTKAINKRELLKVKIKLLCYQHKYDECYNLFVDNGDIFKLDFDDYYSSLVFLKKKLSLPISDEVCSKSYTVAQIVSYSEERAIEHIKKHVDNFDSKEGSCFNSDFPVEEVYHKLRQILPIETDLYSYSGIGRVVYIFKYEGNGRYFRKVTDYIRVVCVQDTNEIITMYPYENSQNLQFIDIDFGIKRVEEEKPRTKRLSQIDKFNQRYNK